MDLPPDKIRLLRDYDLKKKWDLVRDQKNMYSVTDSSVYLEKLSLYLDPKTFKKSKKKLGNDTSTSILKHIEISLRTNSIDWVKSFLDPSTNNGLKVLIEYLTQLQSSVVQNQLLNADNIPQQTTTASILSTSGGFSYTSGEYYGGNTLTSNSSSGHDEGIIKLKKFFFLINIYFFSRKYRGSSNITHKYAINITCTNKTKFISKSY